MRRLTGYRIGLFLALTLLVGGGPALAQEESVCLQCHGDLEGRLGTPVEKWRGSIHSGNGISCHDCHGGDPTDMAMAMSPERGFLGVPAGEEIPAFCGRCHVGVLEDYQESAHGQALGAGGPQCATCHGSHAVDKASPELINREDCTRCHEYGRAEEIKEAVVETDGRITGLEDSLRGLHRIGIATKELEDRLFALRNQFHRLFHTVEVEKVRRRTEEFQEELKGIREQVDAVEAKLRQRKMAGGGVVFLLLVGSVAALLLHRSYVQEED